VNKGEWALKQAADFETSDCASEGLGREKYLQNFFEMSSEAQLFTKS